MFKLFPIHNLLALIPEEIEPSHTWQVRNSRKFICIHLPWAENWPSEEYCFAR